MLYNTNIANQFTEKLVEIQAIKLNPHHPFTWASGWKSPIYCDNRLTLSHPSIRSFIKNNLTELILQKFRDVEIIAAVATAGIPHGVLVAEKMNLPFIYVRSEAKKHGLTNLIEGRLEADKKVVVIEDLISTGGSSLHAVQAIKQAGGNVEGLVALFSYAFDIADEAFKNAECTYYTLADYPTLIHYALVNGLIDKQSEHILNNWRKNPSAWGQ